MQVADAPGISRVRLPSGRTGDPVHRLVGGGSALAQDRALHDQCLGVDLAPGVPQLQLALCR